jgi:hypothetical protein
MARPVETTVVQFIYPTCPDYDFSTLIGEAGVTVFGQAASQSTDITEWADDTTAMIDRDGVRIIIAFAEPQHADDVFTLTIAIGPTDMDSAPRALLRAAAGMCQTIADAVAEHCPADHTEWHWLPRVMSPEDLHMALLPNVVTVVRPNRIHASQSRHNRPVNTHTDQRHIRPEHPAVLIARSARQPRRSRLTNERIMRVTITEARKAMYAVEPAAPKHYARLSAHMIVITGMFMSVSNTAFAQQVLGLF